MMPRLGAKYPIKIETTSKPIAEYQTDAYFELDLPVAPAVMVGDEIVVEGANVAEERVEAVIRRHLGLPEHQPRKKSLFARLLGR
jgi:predicted HAD superfamily phosphohydrolase YqeG